MSATGFEETDLTYQVSESDSSGETKDTLKPVFTVTNLPGTTSTMQTAPATSTTVQASSGPSFPIANDLHQCLPVSAPVLSAVPTGLCSRVQAAALSPLGPYAAAYQLHPHVWHHPPCSQVQEPGGVPRVFLTASSGTVQIPVSAVQLHQMAVIGQQAQSSSNLTELQLLNLDPAHSTESE
ncbi:Serum response factor [Plecturocebus cupreus]